MKSKRSARRGRAETPTAALPPVGKLLRKIRGGDNVTEAAAKIGARPTWWSRRELGHKPPSVDDLQAIAAAYGCRFTIGRTGLQLEK